MNSRIDHDKLSVRMHRQGEILEYSAELKHISSTEQKQILAIGKEVRSLLRAKDNITDAREAMKELESRLKTTDDVTDLSHRALFCHAVIFYGACFVKGGTPRTFPLKTLHQTIESLEFHDHIMRDRNNLIAHLDDDNPDRIDRLEWAFVPIADGVIPKKPQLAGPKTILRMGRYFCLWNEHVNKILELIDGRLTTVKEQVHTLIGTVSVENKPS